MGYDFSWNSMMQVGSVDNVANSMGQSSGFTTYGNIAQPIQTSLTESAYSVPGSLRPLAPQATSLSVIADWARNDWMTNSGQGLLATQAAPIIDTWQTPQIPSLSTGGIVASPSQPNPWLDPWTDTVKALNPVTIAQGINKGFAEALTRPITDTFSAIPEALLMGAGLKAKPAAQATAQQVPTQAQQQPGLFNIGFPGLGGIFGNTAQGSGTNPVKTAAGGSLLGGSAGILIILALIVLVVLAARK